MGPLKKLVNLLKLSREKIKIFKKKFKNFKLPLSNQQRQFTILRKQNDLSKLKDLKFKVILKKLKPLSNQKKPKPFVFKLNFNSSNKKSTEELPKKMKKSIIQEEMPHALLNKFRLLWILK